jgi:hypothetical protein
MRYDLLVTQINNESSRKVLAHQLARDPGTTFQDALLKLQKLPVVLFKDIDEQTMASMVGQYLKYGVRLKAVPAQQKSEVESTNHSELQTIVNVKTDRSNPMDGAINKAHVAIRFDGVTEHRGSVAGRVALFKNADQLEENEKKKRTKERTVLLIFLLLFLIVPLILLLISSEKKVNRNFSGSGEAVSGQPAKGADAQNKHRKKNPAESELSKRKSVSTSDQKKSVAMCDSAKDAGTNTATLINFYKIAISFNKYNLEAWFGLLGAYKSAGMSEEYLLASNQMKELFGDKVFDISSQVKRYGEIEDMFENENGVLTIKYRSSDPLDELQERVYSLIKILHSNYNYPSVSVEIADKKTERMIVHVRPGMEIATFADFKKNASVMIFDKN